MIYSLVRSMLHQATNVNRAPAVYFLVLAVLIKWVSPLPLRICLFQAMPFDPSHATLAPSDLPAPMYPHCLVSRLVSSRLALSRISTPSYLPLDPSRSASWEARYMRPKVYSKNDSSLVWNISYQGIFHLYCPIIRGTRWIVGRQCLMRPKSPCVRDRNNAKV